MIDMSEYENRRRLSEIAQRHADLVEQLEPFKQGPLDEEDLAHISWLAGEIFDVDKIICEIGRESRTEAVDNIKALFAMTWAAGFKTGAEMYGQQ